MKISSRQAILAAMAGITHSAFVTEICNTGFVGKITLGGYPIGKDMIYAAIAAKHRGRTEFILNEGMEVEYIADELRNLPSHADVLLNVRINEPEEAKLFTNQLSQNLSSKPIIEVNAHCQQPEFLEKGGGQQLLNRLPILEKIITIFQTHDFRVSVKILGNAVEPWSFIQVANKWELDYIHVDSYSQGKQGTDLALLKQFVLHSDKAIIGNNSVMDTTSAKAILNTGAKFFSVARAARENVNIFKEIINHN